MFLLQRTRCGRELGQATPGLPCTSGRKTSRILRDCQAPACPPLERKGNTSTSSSTSTTPTAMDKQTEMTMRLFRVPFDASAKDPTAGVDQCNHQRSMELHVPNPQRDQLLLTCSRGGTLMSIPSLSGMVPRGGCRAHSGGSRSGWDHWTRLLLLGHLYGIDPSSANRVEVMREMLLLHFELREYASLAFYDRVTPWRERTGKMGLGALDAVLFFRDHEESLARGMESEVFVGLARKLKDDLGAISVTGDLHALHDSK